MRLNRLFQATLCCLLLSGVAESTLALPEDRSQPIHISANSASINEKTGVTVYSGQVEISQGSMKIRGDRVELYRSADGDVNRIVSIGKPAEFEQQPKASDPVTHAYGLRMEYKINSQQVTISEQAKVEQGQDTFTGERIVYNMDKAIVDAYSSESGDQRVKMVIQPKSSRNGLNP
ncbi:LptA, protein essential for LPS transport across the periplasm [Marinobacterium lacunae]|uniref:Lipopolysaccharide export system protein LptA n=1 Tax=Marinobacterium lacunae TaxID=1232683 RepID=A0A081FXK6_9GAMM|nr:lipopolysaccharide transport periplasmic protein LptA [Marinobacterium lacunae]KEA63261.1 LptA, protein essential for LPS transport across the periplasm [Marinobacterium lacunae]MBR9882848.1 lipopolysaccharide transport periplasmic protein LptA [Oceanospirillales bacterium]